MSYASPMQTKHVCWMLFLGLAAGCGDEFTGAGGTDEDTDTEDAPTGSASPTGVSAGWDDESSTTGAEGSGDGGGCGSAPACSGETPFCVEGSCVGCAELDDGGAACLSADPDRPVCTEQGCAQCSPLDVSSCGDATPVCGETGECRGCVAHDECETACELETGRCFDEAVVVGEDGGVMAGELSALLDTVEPGERLAVRLVPGAQCALDTLMLDDERSIALLGEPGRRPCLTSWDEAAAITVTEGASLYLVDVRVEASHGRALEARASSVYAERVELVNNSGGAVAISQDAYLHLRNATLGGDRNNVPVVWTHSSTLDVAYSTIVAGFGDAQAVTCEADNAVTIRNSIVVSEASLGEIDCPMADVRDSALEAVFGVGNVAVGQVETGRWFVDFPGGDLHLRTEDQGTPFERVGRWSEGDPAVDIDGDPRPLVSDAEDWVGADIP